MDMTRTDYSDIHTSDPAEARRLSGKLSGDEFTKRHTVLRPDHLKSSKRFWDLCVKDGVEAALVEKDEKLICFMHKDGEIICGCGNKPMAFDNMDFQLNDVSSLEPLI